METGRKRKKIATMLLLVALLLLAAPAFVLLHKRHAQTNGTPPGQIFLYGEAHGDERILEKEFTLWSSYYHDNGMRDLFVELPYYTAEYLNLWMRSDGDAILDVLYQDWEGTALQSPAILDFYKKIKNGCPETIFHGTDVGHQYATTGERFLQYLKENGQKNSGTYKRTKENIRQGKKYYRSGDFVYRENTMAQNFIREAESLNGADFMGIYGNAHTDVWAMDYKTGTIPCMANQLREKYGTLLYSEDLALSVKEDEASRVDMFTIAGREYCASYFGRVDLNGILPGYEYRDFWRIEDAYGDFKDIPAADNFLPYNNYPMKIETGQVFLVEYKKTDGSTVQEYYRSDGGTWSGMPATRQFFIAP